MIHIQKYTDRMTNLETNLVAVCRSNQLCDRIQFDSLSEPEGNNIYSGVYAPGFEPAEVPEENEDGNGKGSQTTSLILLKENKIAVMERSSLDNANLFVI